MRRASLILLAVVFLAVFLLTRESIRMPWRPAAPVAGPEGSAPDVTEVRPPPPGQGAIRPEAAPPPADAGEPAPSAPAQGAVVSPGFGDGPRSKQDIWTFSPKTRAQIHAMLEGVEDAVREKDYERMQALMDAVRELGAQAVGPLLDILIHDDNLRLPIYASVILGEINAAQPDEALAEALRDYALPYLDNLAETSEDPSLRHAALAALGKIGDERSFDTLLDALTGEPGRLVSGTAGRSIAQLHGEHTTKALESLARAESDVELRARLVEALAGREDPAAFETLVELAERDFSEEVRLEATRGLAALSTPEARDTLRDIVRSPESPDVRAAALGGLGTAGDETDLDLLKDVLRSPAENNVRTSAYKALSRIGTEGALAARSGFGPAARINSVFPGGNAASSGLMSGDLITAYDGQSVTGVHTLQELVRATPPSRTVPVTVVRDGRTLPSRVTGGPLGLTVEDGVAGN